MTHPDLGEGKLWQLRCQKASSQLGKGDVIVASPWVVRTIVRSYRLQLAVYCSLPSFHRHYTLPSSGSPNPNLGSTSCSTHSFPWLWSLLFCLEWLTNRKSSSFSFGLSLFRGCPANQLFTVSSTLTPTTCMTSFTASSLANLSASYLVAPYLAFSYQCIHCPSLHMSFGICIMIWL